MVLGKAQLSVLRRLKEEGTVEDGLHMSVHGLVREDFVEYIEDAGFRIAQKGQLALIAYDELNEAQREILMRVHKSNAKMEKYNLDALKTPAEKEAFDDLLLAELITVDEKDNIGLTDSGRILWEVVVLAWHTKDATRGGFDEANAKQRDKKASTKETIVNKVRPLPEKKAEEKRLKTEPKTVVNGIVDEAVETAENTGLLPSFGTPPSDCPDCGDCIHAEVLELIAAKYPKVAELRDTLMKQKQLLKDLGL